MLHLRIPTDTAEDTRLGSPAITPCPVMPDALAYKLAHPDEGKPRIEHTGDKIVRLTTELLAAMKHLHQYGYMAVDDACTAAIGLEAIEDSGECDDYGAQSEIKALRVWFTSLLNDWQTEWDEVGRYECDQNTPRYFRG